MGGYLLHLGKTIVASLPMTNLDFSLSISVSRPEHLLFYPEPGLSDFEQWQCNPEHVPIYPEHN